MLTLVIDTASSVGTVGVVEGDALVVERRWEVTTTYSLELLAVVEAVLAEAGVERTAIEGVVVCVGPGAYGGLRAGVATAQGLALGLDVPLAGVQRLEADAVAHLAPHPGGRDTRDASRVVVAVHHAGSAGIAWAAYAPASEPDGAPREVRAPRLGTAEECAGAAPQGARWCGELTEELRAALDARGADAGGAAGWTEAVITATMQLSNSRTLTEPVVRATARSLDMVRLARAHDAFGDPAGVDVYYLRPPSITPPREGYAAQGRS